MPAKLLSKFSNGCVVEYAGEAYKAVHVGTADSDREAAKEIDHLRKQGVKEHLLIAIARGEEVTTVFYPYGDKSGGILVVE